MFHHFLSILLPSFSHHSRDFRRFPPPKRCRAQQASCRGIPAPLMGAAHFATDAPTRSTVETTPTTGVKGVTAYRVDRGWMNGGWMDHFWSHSHRSFLYFVRWMVKWLFATWYHNWNLLDQLLPSSSSFLKTWRSHSLSHEARCLTEAGREGIEANSQKDGSQNHLEGGHHNPSCIHWHHSTQNQLADQRSHKDTSKGGWGGHQDLKLRIHWWISGCCFGCWPERNPDRATVDHGPELGCCWCTGTS